ncbi:RusA-like Holliday junction resolvase [Erwinia phage vB_EamP-S6]|uniref:Gp076 n=1 Tax=Erwinia phage vB_EamP-S6 TaxID=1051675 RepID=G0YQG8_9CAUD|nr:RusA-like Holliday junction resolvase [Erwinia phage vB_EamP-S6]AEJ81595.1 gp076 [Erwinia phage vB_EamP-S6]
MITAPISVPISKNKSLALNLNIYRNAHYQSLNKAKVNFKEAMREQIEPLTAMTTITVRYVLFVGSRRLTDVANVCTVVDKFFMDALVEFGKLPDDNYVHLPKVIYEFGGYDKENPRVEIYIEETQ